MCGIVGIINRDRQPVERAVLADMAHAIRHRGPDGEGCFIDGPVGFYHKRLAIIDLVTGAQPMTRGPLTVCFNGEIYNYVELRAESACSAATRSTRPRTPRSFSRCTRSTAPECVKRLNGMFAFLLYDRDRQTVFVARDHFGIKPLYYYASDRHILFASEIKALLQHPSVTAVPDQDAVREYVTFQFVTGEHTMFAGIRKLRPGHWQMIDLASGDQRTECFWEPRFSIDPYHTEEYFVVEVRRLLEDAIRLQLRSDVPVGAYLSGGMDSSIVTLLAAPHAAPPFHTFTGVFREGPEFDETRYSREVAGMCQAHGARDRPDRAAVRRPDAVAWCTRWTSRSPAPDSSRNSSSARCAAQTVKVVLGGQGGDEIFGGYARYMVAYLEQAIKGAIFESNEEAEHIVSLKSIIPNLPALRQYAPMLQTFWRQDVFEPMDRRYFRLIDRSGGALSLFSDDFRAAYRSRGALRALPGRVQSPGHAVVLQQDDALRSGDRPAGAPPRGGSRQHGGVAGIARPDPRPPGGRSGRPACHPA